MTSDRTHLTEDERQQWADGTLAEEERVDVGAHLDSCADCAADVARITTLMKRIREAPVPDAPLEELWPSIRSRIEQSKVIALAPGAPTASRGEGRRAWWFASIGLAAAALVIAVFSLRDQGPVDVAPTAANAGDTTPLIAVVDSAHAYEREAQILLDKLELQRAMLRPDAVKALDHDLRVVDVAIAELKAAVARDPANPALRQLLAASYRQKVDLLKRVTNAG